MKRTIGRIVALCLTLVLTAGVVSGCGSLNDSINDFTWDIDDVLNTTRYTQPTTEENVPTTTEGEIDEVPEVTTQPTTQESTTPTTAGTTEDNLIDPAFKEAMDSYEKFFDEYVAIMKKYQANPTDMGLIADYFAYLGQYSDMMQKMEKWEDEDLNDAELAYYIAVHARITKKLAEVAD